MNPSDKLPTRADIAPVELSSNTAQPMPPSGHTFEEWLDQQAVPLNETGDTDGANSGKSLNSFTISLPRFLLTIVLLLVLIPALAIGGYGIYNSLHKPPTTSLSNKATDLGSLLTPDNQTLHINFDTLLDSGKKLTATGQVTIQNEADSTNAFSIQDANGKSLLVADTKDSRVSINGAPVGPAALQVNGDISTNGSVISPNGGFSLSNDGLRIGNILVCTARGCVSSSSPSPTPASPTIDVANLAYINQNQNFSGANVFSNLANSFSGNGAGLTALNASNVSSGTLDDARLSSNIARLNADQTFSGSNTFKDAAASSNAFAVQDAATDTLLSVDTTARSASGGNIVKIGDNSGTDANTTILVLDSATANPTSNLSALSGGLFYNSTTGKINIIENGVVKTLCNTTDLSCGGNATTLQQAYDYSVSSPQITLDSSPGAGGLVIQDNATPLGTALFTVQSNGGGLKYLNVSASGVAIDHTTANYPLDVTGDINSSTGLRVGGVLVCDSSGCTASSGSGSYIQNGTGTQLANLNIRSAASTNITAVLEGASGQSADILDVQAFGGATKYLTVNTGGLSVTGNTNITGQYQVGGLQISSANLSNDSNLAKLNANQTFSGNNTFSSASNSFTGDGSGLTGLNGTNIASGTVADARLSTNVVLKNGNNTLTASNIFQTAVNTTNGFQIQNAAGTSNLFVADTFDTRIAIGQAAANYPLDVAGDINSTTGIRVGGTLLCSAGGCLAASGSGSYVQNGTTTQVANFNVRSNAAGSVAGVLEGASGQSVDILDVQSFGGATKYLAVSTSGISVAGNVNTTGQYQVNGSQIASSNLSDSPNLAKLNANQTFSGYNTFKPAADSATAFQLQNASGMSLFNVDTSNSNISLGQLTTGALAAWSTNTNVLPAVRNGAASVVANNYIYVIGGCSSQGCSSNSEVSTVYYAKLNPDGSAASWTTNTNALPGSRGWESAVASNGYIYVLGGEDGATTPQSTVYYAKLNADGSTGVWQNNANALPQARYATASVIVNGYIYLMGGSNSSSTPQSTVYYAKLNADGSISAWQTNSVAMPAARSFAGSTTSNGYLYIVGGTDGSNVQSTVYYAIPNLDGSISSWSSSAIPAARYTPSVLTVNNYLYVLGGMDNSNVLQSTVYYAPLNINGSIGTWNTNINALPQTLKWASGVVNNGYLYFVGGYNGSLVQSTIYYASVQGMTRNSGQSSIADQLTVGNGLTVSGNVALQPSADSTSAFSLQNATGGSLINVDSVNNAINLLGNESGQLGYWYTSANGLLSTRDLAVTLTSNGYAYSIGGNNGSSQTAVYYAKLNADGSTGTWSANTNALPTARDAASGITANGYIYIFGGENSGTGQSTIYYAKLNSDGSTGTWSTSSNSLPAALSFASAVTANGYVYVLGGCPSTCSSQVSTVYYAKLNADGSISAWQTNANALPQNLSSATSVVANGYVYEIGGIDSGTVQSTVYYAKLNSDGSTGTWTTATNALPQALNRQASVVSNGYVYVIGGSVTSAQSTVYYAKLNADGSTGVWQTNANALPQTLDWPSSVLVNGYVYVLGGRNSGGAWQSNVYYASTSRIQIGANLDLIGLQGGTLADAGGIGVGSTGGSITAGNGTFVGGLQVLGASSFANGVGINGALTVNNSATFTSATGLTSAFSVQSTTGSQAINVNTVTTPNLISNGDFESSINGWGGKGAATIARNDSSPSGYSGVGDLKITTTAAANDGAYFNYTFAASTQYTLSLYAYSSSSISTINIGRQEVSGTDIDCLTGQTVSNSWTRYTCTFTTGATITPPTQVYIKQSDATARTFYIDAVQLEQAGSASAFQGSQANLQVQTATNTITLDGSDSGTLGPWTTGVNNLPAARDRAGSVVANSYIYEIGGDNTNGNNRQSTIYYAKLNADGSTGAWQTSTQPLPIANADFGTVASNGYVYMIGGCTAGTCSGSLTTVYYAKLNTDGSTGAWQLSSNSLPQPIWAPLATITANGYVYLMGGYNNATPQTTVYYAKLNADGSTGVWQTNAIPLPVADFSSAAVVANGYVYIREGTSLLYAKLNSDGSVGSWTTVSGLANVQNLSSAVVSNGYMYVLGGNYLSASSTVYYAKLNADGSTGTWQSTTSMPAPRFAAGGVTANGYIYMVGGNDASNTYSTVYYASTSRIQIGANLDLVGLQGGTLSDPGALGIGSVGGSITAGNGTFVGSLQVQGAVSLAQGVRIGGNLTVGGSVLFQNAANSTTAFQVQNASNTNLLVIDTTDGQIAIGPSSVPGNGVLTIGTNTTTASGGLYFGTDTNLYRIGVGALASDSTLQVGTSGSGTLSIGNANSGLQINQGGAAAGIRNLNQTAGAASLSISAGAGASQIRFDSNAGDGTGGVLFYSGGASPAVVLQADSTGKLLWGSSADTNLYRVSSGVLQTDGTFRTGNNLLVAQSQANPTTAAFGIGFGSGADTNLYRSAASTLKTDSSFDIQTATNSVTALQVQNSSGTVVLAADTTNQQINVVNLQATGTISLQNGQGASIQLRTVSASSTGLTMSGNEITDTTRSVNIQGDGRQPPDSSTGIWESTTNLVTNGGFESDITGWSNFNTGVISQDTSKSKFGTASGKIIALATADGARFSVSGLTASSTYTASAWVFATSGGQVDMSLESPTGTFLGKTTMITGNGTWQRITGTFTAGTGGTASIYPVSENGAQTFWIDGVQLEQKAYATPYVETNGATVTRNGARVQAPAATTNATQGWFAARIRMGWSSSGSLPNSAAGIYEWADSDSNRIFIAFTTASSVEVYRDSTGGGSGEVTVGTGSFNQGDILTIVGYWTSTTMAVSINGGSFSTGTYTGALPTIANSTYNIGSLYTHSGGQQIDGDMLWTAAGTGTLSNSDATSLYKLGNSDPTISGLNTIDSASTPTFAWDGESNAYTGTNSSYASGSAITIDDTTLYRNYLNPSSGGLILQGSALNGVAPASLSSAASAQFGVSTPGGGMLAEGVDSTGTVYASTYVYLQGRNVGGAGVAYNIVLQPQGGNVILGVANGSATPTLLVLGAKNTSGDPTCTNGAVYYNSSSNLFRACSNGTWGTFGVKAPGYELGYAQITAPVTINNGVGYQTVMTGPTVTFDGNTKIFIEVFLDDAQTASASSGASLTVTLFDGATQMGNCLSLSQLVGSDSDSPGNTTYTPNDQRDVLCKFSVTPSAGSHTYTVEATAGNRNGSIGAGTGLSGSDVPSYIRYVAE